MSVTTPVRVPTPMFMAKVMFMVIFMAMVLPGLVVLFHWPNLTSVARTSAYATAMGTIRVPITR